MRSGQGFGFCVWGQSLCAVIGGAASWALGQRAHRPRSYHCPRRAVVVGAQSLDPERGSREKTGPVLVGFGLWTHTMPIPTIPSPVFFFLSGGHTINRDRAIPQTRLGPPTLGGGSVSPPPWPPMYPSFPGTVEKERVCVVTGHSGGYEDVFRGWARKTEALCTANQGLTPFQRTNRERDSIPICALRHGTVPAVG